MKGYLCIAMLEDPPYNIILAATEAEPEDWVETLPLPSHLILSELFQDVNEIKQQFIKNLQSEGIAAASNKAFSAQIHEVLHVYQQVRDKVKFGDIANESERYVKAKTSTSGKDKHKSEAEECFELAENYYHGNGVELNREKARELYIKAAELNHAEAKYKLGNIYSGLVHSAGGTDISAYRQSESWYRSAAEQGHIAALSHMAWMADTKKQAENWYNKIRKAAEQGNADAQYQLGQDYYLEFSSLSEKFKIEQDEELKDFWYSKAAKSYAKMAEQGDTAAQVKLAWMYTMGDGLETDNEESVFWYRKAAEQGHAEAMWWLGRKYVNGSGVSINAKEAASWFQQAAEKGEVCAQINLFEMYTQGRGVKQDNTLAAYWCRKAADRDHTNAMIYLSGLYLEGLGVERSDELADFWLRKAAQGRSVEYDFQKIAKPYSVENDHIFPKPGIVFKWAQFYATGDGLPQDDEKALTWFCEAAEQGYVPAQCRLAGMYLNGTGVEKDDQQAFSWFQKAAEQGDASGQYNLAVMCFKGRGINQDNKQAIFWCKKAALQGYRAAEEALLKIGVEWS